jgi:hypothetical protein
LLGLYASREAIDQGEKNISVVYVQAAIKKALEGAQQTTLSTYHKATEAAFRKIKFGSL